MGLFDHLKKKKETEQIVLPKVDTTGFLLFDRADMDIQSMEDKIRQTFGQKASIDTDCSNPSVVHMVIKLEEVEFWGSYMPFPIPAEEMDIAYTVQYNRLTPEEKQAFCAHQSFLLFVQKGGGKSLEDKRHICRLFSQLCGAWMGLSGAVGFCLNTTGLLVGRNDYLRHIEVLNGEAGQDPAYFPAPLWIWVLPLQEGDRQTIESWGLKEFGFQELQFLAPSSEYGEICSRIYMMSILQITGKAHYKSMDTITFENGKTAVFKKNGGKMTVIVSK